MLEWGWKDASARAARQAQGIHSPDIPTQQHIVQPMRKAAERVPAERRGSTPAAASRRVLDNARVVAQTLTERGLRTVSGGTQSHVMLVDLRAKLAALTQRFPVYC